MMKQQSPEFLLGYLFSEIERKIIKDITGRDNSGLPRKPDTYTAQIPLLWFGITRPNSSYHNTPMVMLNVEQDMSLSENRLRTLNGTVILQ